MADQTNRRRDVVLRVLREPQLRRLELAFLLFALLEGAAWLAMVVDAYGRGGVAAAGTLTFVALGAAVVVAPFASYAGFIFQPRHAVSVGYAVLSVTMVCVAVAMVVDVDLLVYVSVVAMSCATTFARPLTRAVLPTMATRPADLVAANVLVGSLEHLGAMLGPLLVAGLLVVGAPWTVFALAAVASLVAAAITLGISPAEGGAPTAESDDAATTRAAMTPTALRHQVFGGVRALRSEPVVRMLVVVIATVAAVAGMMDVLIVVLAESRLGGGGSQAGLLAAAIGGGTVLGAFVATGMISSHRVSRYFFGGAVLIGAPLAAVSLEPAVVGTVLLLATVGLGRGIVAEAGFVAVQRRAPRELLVRVFGVFESMQLLAMAGGVAAVTIAVEVFDVAVATLLLGSATMLALLATTLMLIVRGGNTAPPDPVVLQRIRDDPMFAPLDASVVERLAVEAEWTTYPAGHVVIAEGDSGDRFYLVLSGSLEVTGEGSYLRTVGPGESFGEIALIHDVPRTATVTCRDQVDLLAVQREVFLEAVTGHPTSLSVARAVAADRLG